MAINLTDALNAATTKGKLADAKQIYLEGDNKNLQDAHKDNEDHLSTLDTRSTQIEEALKTIAATGGASNANAVIYDNNVSGLTAINVKGAIDELANKKTDKTDIDVELNKKFDKKSVVQESGDGEDKVMSQKATTTAIAHETKRATEAEKANTTAIEEAISKNEKLSELVQNIVYLKEYIGYPNIMDLSLVLNQQKIYYTTINNRTLIGARIKSRVGNVSFYKVTANPIGTVADNITTELIGNTYNIANEEGKIKDIIFSNKVIFGEHDYLGISGCFYLGSVFGEKMYMVDTNETIKKDFSLALNGIEEKIIFDELDKNKTDIAQNKTDIAKIKSSLGDNNVEYIGYPNIMDLSLVLNQQKIYYTTINNRTLIGARIKSKSGNVSFYKVTANPIDTVANNITTELIGEYLNYTSEEGKIKDIIFSNKVIFGEHDYLGISGNFYFGPAQEEKMYLVDTNNNGVITNNYSIALNGIEGKIIFNELDKNSTDIAQNKADIAKIKSSLGENILYAILQSDDLQKDNGNFTVKNWEYTDSGIKPSATGSNNYIMNNKIYHSDKRFMRVHVVMGADTILKIPVVWGNGINSGEGASCFAIDLANKKLIIYAVGNGSDTIGTSNGYTDTELDTEIIPDTMIGNREYIVELHKDGTNHILRLLDTLTGESCEVSHNGWGAGRQNQWYAFYCESGTLPTLSNFQVFSLNRPDVVFVGDSITEGVYVTDRTKRYAEQFRINNPDKKVVISARGGDTISGVLAKFATEYNIYKPKMMSVLIGANGGNTLQNLTKLKNNCEAIGCTLILHRRTCQQSKDSHIDGNELIKQIGVNGARFDIATAKDNFPYVDDTHTYPRYNETLYADAGLHPNNEGNTKMYNRLLIDTPELFYN